MNKFGYEILIVILCMITFIQFCIIEKLTAESATYQAKYECFKELKK